MTEEKTEKPMTYAAAGVDYGAMDPFKVAAQQAARATSGSLERFDFQEDPRSRGESAYLIEMPNGMTVAHVEEGLGTKNLVADAMYRLTGRTFYDHIAQDTVAMIVNDMITVGALPVSLAMHVASGDSDWFTDDRRALDLIRGWKRACDLSGCAWGGGESPTLRDVVVPGTVVLSGSAVGVIRERKDRIIDELTDDDQIVLLSSSGIHANGLTLARQIAAKLPEGYLTKLSDGRTYGEALLDPTHIYVPVIEDCQKEGVSIHYAANITGHGWRKLMRSPRGFAYVIDQIPEPHPVFRFMQEHGPVSDREAFGNLNMGAGFALFVYAYNVPKVLAIASRHGIGGLHAGSVKKSHEKKLTIKPLNLVYEGSSLAVR